MSLRITSVIKKKTFKKLNEWLIISILTPNVHSLSTEPVSASIPGADWKKSYLRVRHFYHRRYGVCACVCVCENWQVLNVEFCNIFIC